MTLMTARAPVDEVLSSAARHITVQVGRQKAWRLRFGVDQLPLLHQHTIQFHVAAVCITANMMQYMHYTPLYQLINKLHSVSVRNPPHDVVIADVVLHDHRYYRYS